MPVRIVEEPGRQGQLGESGSAERSYMAIGATTEDEALQALFNSLFTELGAGLSITIGTRTLVLRNVQAVEVARQNGWRCLAQFGSFDVKPLLQVDETSFHFEIGIQPVKVVVPLQQQVYKRASDPNPLPDIHLIGDQGIPGEEPSGVDIYEPFHVQRITKIFPASAISSVYQRTITQIVGRTNAAPFYGNDALECLLQSVSGQKRGGSDWEVSFSWAVRANQTGLSVGGVTGITKAGWDYLWPIYFLGKDANNAPKLTRQIRYIVVSRVFAPANFALLGIGV